MMSRSVKPILVVLCCALVIPIGARAATLVVDQDEGPYFTIGSAVVASTTDDVISIEDDSPAVYDEQIADEIAVATSITIEDNATAQVTLSNTVGSRSYGYFTVTGGVAVTVRGLRFIDTRGMGIRADGATVTVEDCYFSGCDGNEDAIGGDCGATIDVINGGVVHLSGCTFDNSVAAEGRNGSIIAANGTGVEVNADNCTFKNRRNPAGNGTYGERSAAVCFVLEATGTFSRCEWECDGAAGLLLIFGGGATVDRCLFRPLIWDGTGMCDDLIRLQGSDTLGTVYLAVNNTVLDGRHSQDADPKSCIKVQSESYVNVNSSTIIWGYHGIYGIGNPYDLKVTNSLIGRNSGWGIRWIYQEDPYTWDLWVQDNHFWANAGGGHFPTSGTGLIMHSNVGNTDGDDPGLDDIPWAGMDPASVNYELQNTAEMADLGLSTLLGPLVTDDLDEVGVRPRGSANDKGAQEGQAPVATSTPTRTPSTGVSDWEEIYR